MAATGTTTLLIKYTELFWPGIFEKFPLEFKNTFHDYIGIRVDSGFETKGHDVGLYQAWELSTISGQFINNAFLSVDLWVMEKGSRGP